MIIGDFIWESDPLVVLNTVLLFVKSRFSPTGVVGNAGLFAPESQVLQGINVLRLVDGLFSTVKFGIISCKNMAEESLNNSFESWRDGYPFQCPENEGETHLSPARTTYWPSSPGSVDAILDELSLLLTAGRLGEKSHAIIKPAVEQAFNSGDVAKAVRIAQQLISASPEFHSTGIARQEGAGTARAIEGYPPLPASADDYKAVVIIMLVGGECIREDSFRSTRPTSLYLNTVPSFVKSRMRFLQFARADYSVRIFRLHQSSRQKALSSLSKHHKFSEQQRPRNEQGS